MLRDLQKMKTQTIDKQQMGIQLDTPVYNFLKHQAEKAGVSMNWIINQQLRTLMNKTFDRYESRHTSDN